MRYILVVGAVDYVGCCTDGEVLITSMDCLR